MEPTCIPFVFPGISGVRCVFQTRAGGVSQAPWNDGNISSSVGDDPSHVAANLEALRKKLGLDALAELSQVHGTEMVFDPSPGDPVREADGLAACRPGIGLLIKTADCQPILLAHAGGRHIAAIHAGWRGSRQNFPGKAVESFCRHYGLKPADLSAVRGPSLGPKQSEFINYATEWGPDFDQWYDAETKMVDLWRMTRDQLAEAGLRPDRVYGLDLCTASLPELFFSYRVARVTGRQGSVIWIEKASHGA